MLTSDGATGMESRRLVRGGLGGVVAVVAALAVWFGSTVAVVVLSGGPRFVAGCVVVGFSAVVPLFLDWMMPGRGRGRRWFLVSSSPVAVELARSGVDGAGDGRLLGGQGAGRAGVPMVGPDGVCAVPVPAASVGPLVRSDAGRGSVGGVAVVVGGPVR